MAIGLVTFLLPSAVLDATKQSLVRLGAVPELHIELPQKFTIPVESPRASTT